ncbi:MAG: hypothetical protein IKH57_21070 [Clostridia bacterium]|nr:hypothetical protein [Clostridia bacterium]
MFRKQRVLSRGGRRLACLLFAVLMMGACFVPAYCEDTALPTNVSGNPNLPPAVDPIWPGAQYTAVLYNNRNGLPTSEVKAIAQTDDGFIWIGAYSGLIRYDGNTFERIQADVPISNVMVLLKDSRNRLWIGTNDAGFLMMENGRFRRWGTADGLESLSVRHFAEDADGCLYVGTTSSLVILGPEMALRAESDDRLSDNIQKIRRGGDGRMYVLTRAGDLAVYSKGVQISKLNAGDCAVEDINCMLPDSENPGWFWLGDNGSWLYYGEASNGFQNARVTELGALLEPECLEEIGGKIWVCCRNGIAALDGDEVRALEDVPMNDSVSHVMTDFQGNLWFTSTKQGVMKVAPNRFEDMFSKWGLPEQAINATCLYDSTLFLATDNGLLALRDGEALDSLQRPGRLPGRPWRWRICFPDWRISAFVP